MCVKLLKSVSWALIKHNWPIWKHLTEKIKLLHVKEKNVLFLPKNDHILAPKHNSNGSKL